MAIFTNKNVVKVQLKNIEEEIRNIVENKDIIAHADLLSDLLYIRAKLKQMI